MAKKGNNNNRSKTKKETEEYINKSLDNMSKDKFKAEEEKKKNIISNIKFKEGFQLKTTKQKEFIQQLHTSEIVIAKGSPGTGKTMIALKGALELLIRNPDKYKQIILVKPIIEAAAESGGQLGFLPGGIDLKILPYLDSYETNVKKLVGSETCKLLFENEIIKFSPLLFLRGSSFDESLVILDESQSVTIGGMKLFVSRKGFNCRLFIIGDTEQSDLRLRNNSIKNGLQDVYDRLQGINKISFLEFTDDDIVRDPLLIEIMKRYRE